MEINAKVMLQALIKDDISCLIEQRDDDPQLLHFKRKFEIENMTKEEILMWVKDETNKSIFTSMLQSWIISSETESWPYEIEEPRRKFIGVVYLGSVVLPTHDKGILSTERTDAFLMLSFFHVLKQGSIDVRLISKNKAVKNCSIAKAGRPFSFEGEETVREPGIIIQSRQNLMSIKHKKVEIMVTTGSYISMKGEECEPILILKIPYKYMSWRRSKTKKYSTMMFRTSEYYTDAMKNMKTLEMKMNEFVAFAQFELGCDIDVESIEYKLAHRPKMKR